MGQNFKKNLGLLRLLPALLLRRHPLHPQEAAQQVHSGHQKGGHRQLLAGLAEAQIILGVLSSILAMQMPCRSCRSGA